MNANSRIIFNTIALLTIINGFGLISSAQKCPEKRVVCYVATWAYYRPGDGLHKITNVVPHYCTHFVYAFTGLSIDGGIQGLDPSYDSSGFKNFLTLREKNPCAKLMVAIGGWNEGSEKYSYMAETAERREVFAESVIRFLIYHGFDGLDLDWEYPTERNGIAADKQNFVELLKVLKARLSARNKILSIAIPASNYLIEKAFDIQQICKTLDFISLMAYDMNRMDATSVHAPLKKEPDENIQTIDDSVQYILKNGCPSDKLVLGITNIARTFTLKHADQTDVGAPITGPGSSGKYLKSKGSLAVNEMCSKFNQTGWTHKLRPNNAVKITYKQTYWAVYDDEETVAIKGKYVLDNGLGGLMFWSIDSDDFQPECHEFKYPMLMAANNALKNPIK